MKKTITILYLIFIHLTAQSQTAKDYYEQAVLKYKNNEYNSALEAINKCISLNSNVAIGYSMRGIILAFGIHNYEDAIKDFSKSILMDPKDKLSYYNRATAYARTDNHIRAVQDFTEAIKIDPNYLQAYFSRAHSKSELKDEIGSIKDLDYLIDNYDGTSSHGFLIGTVYNNKAYSLFKLGKYADALKMADKAVEFGPLESYSWSTRGEIYFKLEKYKDCIFNMNKAIELQDSKKTIAHDYGNGEKWYYRGMSKIQLLDKDGGCADLSQAGEYGKIEAYEEIKRHCN